MPEYAPHGPKDSLWLLISAIYGVKQAARQHFSEVISYATGPMKMIQSQRDPCVLIRWFDQKEVTKYTKYKNNNPNLNKTPAMCTHAHMDSKSAVAETCHMTSNTETRGSSRTHKDRQHGGRHRDSKRGTATALAKVAYLLCGAWVDDKVESSSDSRRGTI